LLQTWAVRDKKDEKLKEKKLAHDNADTENKKLEEHIANADRALVRVRLDHMNVKTELTGFKDEVDVMKNQVSACEKEKHEARNKLQVLAKGLTQRKQKYEMLHKHFTSHQRALGEEQSRTKDKDALSQQAEQAHSDITQNLKLVEKEMKTAKENLFKAGWDAQPHQSPGGGQCLRR